MEEVNTGMGSASDSENEFPHGTTISTKEKYSVPTRIRCEMPVKFLSQLYSRGYMLQKMNMLRPSYFLAITHQVHFYGDPFTAEQTKLLVSDYVAQKRNEGATSSALSDVKIGVCVKRMDDLEQNLREVEDSDFQYTAECFGMELNVYYSNENGEVEMKTFNKRGCEKHDVIAIVLDTYHTPTRYYPTKPIHKNLIINNPYINICPHCGEMEE